MKKQSKIFKNLEPIIIWHKNLSTIDKRILWIFIGFIFFCLILNLAIQTYFEYHNGQILNREHCINLGVQTYNELNELPRFERFVYQYKQIFLVLTFAVAMGWIFHGVGFRIF